MASVAPYDDRSPAIGRVLSRAFATIGANPLAVFGIAFALAALPQALLTIASNALGTSEPLALTLGFSSFLFVGGLTSLILSTITQGALVRITVSYAEGTPTSVGQALSASLRALVPLVVLAVLLALGIALGFALLFVPGIILWLMWSVAAPALVEERCGVIAAFGRSRALTKGARWRILALELVVLVFYWLIAAVIGVAAIFFSHVLNGGSQLIIWAAAWAVVSNTLTAAVWGTIQTSLYVELREWKDGPATGRLADIFA